MANPISIANSDPNFRAGARFGYFTGGATVTQATNRTTGVTINNIVGNITTNNASLAAETAATFTVTNATCFADDIVLVCQQGGSNGGNTTIQVGSVSAGSFTIQVANQNAAGGTAETGAIVIIFMILKASITS